MNPPSPSPSHPPPPPLPPPTRDPRRLTSRFWSGDALRSRGVGAVVRHGRLDVPAPPLRLTADWAREVSSILRLEPGDVEPLPLVRTRARWPDLARCVGAVADWTRALGLGDVLADSDLALMACRGARYHHDGAQYGGSAFCNLFLSEDRGLDVHFPATGCRIPLVSGTVLLFDTGQPHAVVERGSDRFDAADFPPGADRSQVFLTWELAIEDAAVAHALGVEFDTDTDTDTEASTATSTAEAGVLWNGKPADVCPASGRWRPAD